MNYSPDQLEMMRLGQANLARMNDLQMTRRAREPMPAHDPSLLAAMTRAQDASYQQNAAVQQQRQQQNQNTMNNAMRAYDMMNAGSVSGGGGIGGGMASPSFMGGQGAGFTGAGSIGGYSTSLGGGLGAATAGSSSPAFGAAGASSYGLGGGAAAGGAGAGGAAAGGGAAGGGFGGAMASGGPWAAMAAAIAGGKLWQDKEGSNSTGRILHGAFMPSASQYIEDAKQGEWRGIGASLLGLPFLNGFFSSDEAVETAPEWKAPLVNMMGM